MWQQKLVVAVLLLLQSSSVADANFGESVKGYLTGTRNLIITLAIIFLALVLIAAVVCMVVCGMCTKATTSVGNSTATAVTAQSIARTHQAQARPVPPPPMAMMPPQYLGLQPQRPAAPYPVRGRGRGGLSPSRPVRPQPDMVPE